MTLILALGLVAAGPATLAAAVVPATAIQEGVTVTPDKAISRREEDAISSAGVQVLRHIAQARADIHENDPQGAKTELGQTGKLLDQIQEALPTTRVKDRIWIAKKHLEYEDTQEVLPDLVPISASLDALVDVMPVDKAKQHLEQARGSLKSGDRDRAREALDATDAELQYVELDLPLSTTRRLVSEAGTLLDAGRPDDADRALKSAEDSVVYLSLAIEQPMFIAKSLLWQAVVDARAGHKDLAKADLQAAIGYLETSSHSDQKPVREVAQQLLKESRQLQEELNHGKDVDVRIHRLWERAQAFADRSVEYLAAGWEQYRAGDALRDDLIEARLHLAIARIDLFTGHETAQARQELMTSRYYLEKASGILRSQNADQGDAQRIDAMRVAIMNLDKDPATAQETDYRAVEDQLRGVIRRL